MEEIFSPVFTVLKFNNYDEVVEKSNKVVYGLG
jgi:acyl-CoA reductase-like NAD-dependent aldehyde dehydrogenase